MDTFLAEFANNARNAVHDNSHHTCKSGVMSNYTKFMLKWNNW